jgi:hypothetical protein
MAIIIAQGCDRENNYQSNETWFVKMLAKANENGSISSLVNRLARLNESGGTVSLYPGSTEFEAGVEWASGVQVEAPYMHGGLIFHSSANEWSVHT